MSEYQYYEFQAVDRPLDRAAQEALRSLSSRARISATSFTNHYDWGDFSGDPRKLMEQWFDLHLYVANWGTRRLMMRLPKRFLDRADLAPFLSELDWIKLWTSGDNLIVDIHRDEVEPEETWDDDSGWLAALAPLRADVLSGDLRLFYILWLTAVQEELIPDDEVEPLPGISPLTGALEAFARFFDIDPNLVQAAAESGAGDAAMSKDDLHEALAAIAECDKTELLLRVVEGDVHVAAELRRAIRGKCSRPSLTCRTVETLRRRAQEIAEARERAAAERQQAERRRQAEEAEKTRRMQLQALKRRGDSVWREIEDEIERRNASGYARAANLLVDLQALAAEEGSQSDFNRRLATIRARHETKRTFIEPLTRLGHGSGERAS